MEISVLNPLVDAWTIRAAVASRYLAWIYRAMGDGRQASNALRAGAPAEERIQRLGLAPRVADGLSLLRTGELEEIEKENQAWQSLVESQAGISAFHAMADGFAGGRRGLRGTRQATGKAFYRAVQGYHIAFPEQIAKEGVSGAIRSAAFACTEAFRADIQEDAGLAQELHQNIVDALETAAGLMA